MSVTPFRWRQVRPVDATRDEIVTVVSHHLQECVIGLDNATFEIENEDADNVGLDQAPDLRFTFLEIAVGVGKRQRALLLGFEQAHVFDRDRRLVGEGLEKRDLVVGEWSDLPSPEQNYSNGGPLAQQRCRERGAMALAFRVTAARRVLAILCGEIVDMNRPSITYGSSYHPVAI